MGDPRAVYYLAELLRLGDDDNELTNESLREAAAEAIGTITGNAFPPNADGVRLARQWWHRTGSNQYKAMLL